MHKNIFWICFLSLITGAVGWFTLKTLYLVSFYTLINTSAPVENIQWSVEQLKEDQFVLKAAYTFPLHGQIYAGETLFKNDIYWNPWTAEDSLKVYAQKEWTVWYSKLNPQYSSLQKNFPLKECISAGVLWILLIYFFCLGYYVAKRKDI